MHIAAKDVPTDIGLRAAREGLEHTIRVEPSSAPRFSEAIELLDIFSMVDFLRDLPLSRARSLLQVARRMTLPAGEHIVTQGTKGDSFYIIVTGTVQVVRDGVPIKRYRAGDYFGEMAILLDQPRRADVIATTDVDLVALDRNDFLAALRGSEMLARLERLLRVRDEGDGAWELLAQNSVLGHPHERAEDAAADLSRAVHGRRQRGALARRATSRSARTSSTDATVTLRCPEGELKPFTSGAFVGEVDALRASGAFAELGAGDDETGTLFAIEPPDLARFFEDNPGVYLSFLGTRFVE